MHAWGKASGPPNTAGDQQITVGAKSISFFSSMYFLVVAAVHCTVLRNATEPCKLEKPVLHREPFLKKIAAFKQYQ
jgi:hypothetical protein